MTGKMFAKMLLPGFLSWLIPFAISFLFYKPGGELVVPYATFKCSIMTVGVISGCYLLYRHFRWVKDHYIRSGIWVGLIWMTMNIVLDTFVLIPIMKTSFSEYFLSIGLGYISIPAISIAMGALLSHKKSASI